MRLLIITLAAFGSAFAQDIVLPDGKAKAIVQSACSECHGLDQVVSNPMSAEKWKTTVEKMIKKGAGVTPEQLDTVVEYLSVYFAPDKVNVNTASSQDLQSSLQLTAAEADAIVAYRKANGKFQDVASLLRVAGVDPKKIDAKKDLIAF